MKQYLYRVQVVAYPSGSRVKTAHGSYPNPDWEPEGWNPSKEWVRRFGGFTGSQFFWPRTDRQFKARSSARRLRKLMESYGAKCIIQRSAPVVWPAAGEEKVS